MEEIIGMVEVSEIAVKAIKDFLQEFDGAFKKYSYRNDFKRLLELRKSIGVFPVETEGEQ